ncbi:NXPE family member 3-like isoform X2 [Trematomus bernacchii]|uniref:NXPE family member 3-like isoform X2 n=1 Tax=Trematomus bernacchii TaxID=40690 RepID=UPI00146DF3C4|nr:NXPE family member 3-like isoform X2 [Trematomus bernacchii]
MSAPTRHKSNARSGHSVRLELDNIMKESSFKGRRCFTIVLLLLMAFLIFFQLNIWDTLFQPKMSSTIFYSKATTEPPKVCSICNFPPLSPKDALEERLLLESVAWPETPALPSPLSLELTSDPAHSSFTILPARGGGQWHVGDQLEVSIIISDFKGQPKKSGGDFLFARLHNLRLGAGVAGKVVDHLNGSYSAVFPLLWEGAAQVEVTLVHPSEAITVLNRLTSEQPDRVFFISLFRSGSRSETTICNICLRQTKQPICDFTDPRTGDPWFCYKPKNMSCDARIARSTVGYKQTLKAKEDELFQGRVNLKVCIPASGPAGVTVLPKKEGQPEVESSIVNFQASGYYYQGLWRALDGTKVRQFTGASAITQCLKDKVVHLYGDSTIRQWFEFLNATLPDLKEFNLGSSRKNGPFLALDYENKIMVTFRLHGPPLRFDGSFEEIRYIANELDDLIGAPNTVVVVGISAHFASFPIEVYIRRLQRIRSAVVRLLDRAPKTVIIIRTANPKALWLYETITNSDWFSVQCDKVLRAIFKGLNVHLIDAWEMVLAHHLPNSLHPQPPIIKNMMDVLFSYTCPLKGG